MERDMSNGALLGIMIISMLMIVSLYAGFYLMASGFMRGNHQLMHHYNNFRTDLEMYGDLSDISENTYNAAHKSN